MSKTSKEVSIWPREAMPPRGLSCDQRLVMVIEGVEGCYEVRQAKKCPRRFRQQEPPKAKGIGGQG